jgi:hypothetical protein
MTNQQKHMYKYVQTDIILYQHVSYENQAIPSAAHNFTYLTGCGDQNMLVKANNM